MANKQGTNQIVDAFIGDKLIEARYIGAIKYFDAYTEITGTLPLGFNSRAATALKNYCAYGAENGAGVQTINLLDADARDTANGYVANAYLSTDGSENSTQNDYAISEYISVSPSTQYSISSRKISGIALCFYNASKEYISGVTYTYARPRRFTSPSNAAYLRMTILDPSGKMGKRDMLLAGYYDEEPAYEPFGYKIPLMLTTEVTEEMFDKDATDTEKGFVNSSIIRSNGGVLTSSKWCVSEYIPIEIGVTYRLYWGYDASSTAAVAFYDTNKEVLGGYTYGSTVSYTFTPDADGYLRFSYRKDLAEETSLSTSEQISDNYPLFIGSTKLGAEEYADFGEQKVYKRTENLWNPAMDITAERYITSTGSISSKSENYSVSDYIPMSAETEYTISSITTVANAAAYHVFYDANQDVIETTQIGKANQSKTFTTPQNCAYARFSFRSTSVSVDSIMLVEGSTLPETFVPYLQPTDPPAPLPAIIAYEGENTLDSTETVGDVMVKGRISPVYGYTVTQAAYDQLTPEIGKYYAITSTATGEKIWAVKELTQAEYDQLTPVENTLYIIMDNGAVSNVMYVNTAVDVLYLGSTKVWSVSHMPEWMHSGIEELLESTSFVSDNYVDIAYVFTTPVINRDQAYFRVCATSDIVTRLEKSANYYSVFQNPYSSSYRGFYTYDFYYNTETNEWYLAGTTSEQDRGKTENANTSYSHKAIIQNTFTTFTNGTGETNWEDYR